MFKIKIDKVSQTCTRSIQKKWGGGTVLCVGKEYSLMCIGVAKCIEHSVLHRRCKFQGSRAIYSVERKKLLKHVERFLVVRIYLHYIVLNKTP